jgi:hypothetical protein
MVPTQESSAEQGLLTAPNVEDFVLFSSVKVKPETVIEFKNTVLPYAAQTRSEAGCLEYRVIQSYLNRTPQLDRGFEIGWIEFKKV